MWCAFSPRRRLRPAVERVIAMSVMKRSEVGTTLRAVRGRLRRGGPNLAAYLHRRLPWLNLFLGFLVAFLQRTPAARFLAGTGGSALMAAAQLLPATVTVAALGAMHSLAGATAFVGVTNPIFGRVGTPLQLGFTYTGTPSAPTSFKLISGTLPPGLNFIPAPILSTIPSGSPVIAGTPTQAGTFTIRVQGFNAVGYTSDPLEPLPTIVFQIAAAAAAAPVITTPPLGQNATVGATVVFSVQASDAQGFQWRKNGTAIIGATSSTLTLPNVQTSDAATYSVVVSSPIGTTASADALLVVTTPTALPVITTPPLSQSATVGGSAAFNVAASGGATLQWQFNGTAIAGATSPALTVANLTPANAGLYVAALSNNLGATMSPAAILGLGSANKLIGSGTEFPDIFHPGTGFTYDQILLGGAAASVTADAGQILRISSIDLNDDIVQVEFSGAGTLTLVLDNASGPAAPSKYNQSVTYLKGHAGIVLAGANATTNLTVFSVGRAIPGSNPALFKEVAYDGFADLAFIAITSTDGKFGGLRAANASFLAAKGLTGIYAPTVQFTGPVFVSDITASDAATPVLVLGSSADVRITGGDLLQANGRAVQVSGVAQLKFTPGSNSHGVGFNAQTNRARLEQNGADVTAQIVVNPPP